MALFLHDPGNWHSPVRTVFDPQTGSIRTQVDKTEYGFIDQPVRYQGKVFQPKSELHITLVSQDAGILRRLEAHPEDLELFEDAVHSANWSFRKKDEFYAVGESAEVETIIQMVELPGLQPFLKDLSRLTGQGFAVPPTHVTLYTRGAAQGIPLPDKAVFQQRVKARITPGELQLDWTPPGAAGGKERGP